MMEESRFFRLNEQTIELRDFPAKGYILDIGGGGEGVIGQLKGDQVIAIDIFPRELAEAPNSSLKIIMDARELKFLDSTFNTVTAFFSFMFIHPRDHTQVFNEIFRVLVPGGRFMLWDVEIQQRPEPKKDILAFRINVKLPSTIISTGYGTPYTEKTITMEDHIMLAEQAGFKVLQQAINQRTFFCIFRKP